MSYDQAVTHFEALGVDAMKSMRPSTLRIKALCEALDHPELKVPAIHITGTNGKTSTARMASSILAAAGLSVGTYTSPHLQTIRERISLNGQAISRAVFGEIFDHVMPYVDVVERELGERLSYFELLTAMFFLWAVEVPVDAVVVEVGLGGKWDATNVVPASVAVLTNVALDHTALLGSRRAEIAREKAGIIKQGAIVVTSERTPEILEILERACDDAGAGMLRLGKDFAVDENRVALGGRLISMSTTTGDYSDVFLPLHGAHQGVNATLAAQAVASFLPARGLDYQVIAEGFGTTSVPGRLETVKGLGLEAPAVVLDVAHNPEGMAALTRSLAEAFAFERVVFVVGILSDKDYRGMLLEMARLPAVVVVTQPKTVRSVALDELRAATVDIGLECRVDEDVADAVKNALSGATARELICITGSHYVVGEARNLLIGPPEAGETKGEAI